MAVSVTYSEEEGSPVITMVRSKLVVKRKLRCDWDDRWTLMQELLSQHEPVEDYTPPVGAVVPTAIKCGCMPAPGQQTGTGASDQIAAYEKAIVAVDYATPDSENPDPTELLAESLEPTAEFITLDHWRFRWGAANGVQLEEDEAPGKLIRGLDYIVTMYEEATIPAAALTLIGNVNSADVTATLLGLTFTAQTLLYNPPTLRRTITTDGSDAWEITYRFTYRPDGWNKYWRAATQAYSDIYVAGGARYLSYPLGNFGAL